MKKPVVIAVAAAATFLCYTGAARADQITCKGDITSIQGEGLVTRTHRFEVEQVTGSDVVAVLEQCKQIARDRQNRAARKNPAGPFRSISEVNLQCTKGSEQLQVRRALNTAP